MSWKRWALSAFLLGLISTLIFASSVSVSGVSPSRYLPLDKAAFRPFLGSDVSRAVPEGVLSTYQPRPVPTASLPVPATSGYTRLTGEASWGYGFKGHVVTRYPRGTIVRVCGSLGCTGKVASWGYGPAKYTGRIADLDVGVFEHVCGPRSKGICKITLEVWK